MWSVPVALDDDLQELRYGVDNMSGADFTAHYGAFNVRDEPTRQKSPGGESWQQFAARATRAIDRICHTAAGQTVVLVTHGGVIRVLLFSVFRHDLSRPDWGRSLLDYTSITHWRYEQTERGKCWSLLRWNDAAHLHLIGAGAPPAPDSR